MQNIQNSTKKIVVFVPNTHVEQVKHAMFQAGAGAYNNYTHCCWQTKGIGQFMPNNDASPYIGKKHRIQYVEETRVEMLCFDVHVKSVIDAIKAAHPYEAPAFEVSGLEHWGQ